MEYYWAIERSMMSQKNSRVGTSSVPFLNKSSRLSKASELIF